MPRQFSLLLAALSVCVFAAASHAQPAAPEAPPPATSPTAARDAFKAALEKGDVTAIGVYTAGESGASIRKLAPILVRVKKASDDFDQALKTQKLDFKNPFSAGLTPFSGIELSPIEGIMLDVTGKKGTIRVRFGMQGRVQEETLQLFAEEGGTAWRLTLPLDLNKTLPRAERVAEQVAVLTSVAEILDKLTTEIGKDQTLKTKEAVGLRLIDLMAEKKLVK